MIEIKQVDLGLLQDCGRFGYQHLGVPISGVFDREQYQRISLLLDETNPIVIELLRGRLTFMTNSAVDLALTGSLTTSVGQVDHVVSVPAHSEVIVTATTTSYVGIRGLTAPRVLGSVATDTTSGLGPARIAAGDRFETAPATNVQRFIREPLSTSKTIRFIPGPHTPLAVTSAQVTSVSRSGVRLQATIPSTLTLASLPILPGAIQNTVAELIIVGPDGGVTGGYPVVGVVADADLPLLARLQAGIEISLVPTVIGEAISAAPKVHDLSAF